jgi:hypothetical protein
MNVYVKNSDILHKELERFFDCKVNKVKMEKMANNLKGRFRVFLNDISQYEKNNRKDYFIKKIGDIFDN